ncbi:hypothetical protein M0812_23083 [Anaeramoeba flamelloides]|uniref:Uncharacterized protein n=1 Tax=Anaeramoeba flamelloides TaxID=1746091 RepID=A0AAV7YQX2_9EUKA|nr:hypothetical protein M0812_23083 [Anaeramoeba flamelloides]
MGNRIMVSAKYCDDICYDNQSYAKLFGLSLELINQLEVAFLFSVNWNLVLDEGEYEDTLCIIYKKQYLLFYPDHFRKANKIFSSTQLKIKNSQYNPIAENLFNYELKRENEFKCKSQEEIININHNIITRHPIKTPTLDKLIRRKVDTNTKITKEKIRKSKKKSSKDIINKCTEEQINYSNKILMKNINYPIVYKGIILDYPRKCCQKRSVPQNHFQGQRKNKKRIKNQNYSKY